MLTSENDIKTKLLTFTQLTPCHVSNNGLKFVKYLNDTVNKSIQSTSVKENISNSEKDHKDSRRIIGTTDYQAFEDIIKEPESVEPSSIQKVRDATLAGQMIQGCNHDNTKEAALFNRSNTEKLRASSLFLVEGLNELISYLRLSRNGRSEEVQNDTTDEIITINDRSILNKKNDSNLSEKIDILTNPVVKHTIECFDNNHCEVQNLDEQITNMQYNSNKKFCSNKNCQISKNDTNSNVKKNHDLNYIDKKNLNMNNCSDFSQGCIDRSKNHENNQNNSKELDSGSQNTIVEESKLNLSSSNFYNSNNTFETTVKSHVTDIETNKENKSHCLTENCCHSHTESYKSTKDRNIAEGEDIIKLSPLEDLFFNLYVDNILKVHCIEESDKSELNKMWISKDEPIKTTLQYSLSVASSLVSRGQVYLDYTFPEKPEEFETHGCLEGWIRATLAFIGILQNKKQITITHLSNAVKILGWRLDTHSIKMCIRKDVESSIISNTGNLDNILLLCLYIHYKKNMSYEKALSIAELIYTAINDPRLKNDILELKNNLSLNKGKAKKVYARMFGK